MNTKKKTKIEDPITNGRFNPENGAATMKPVDEYRQTEVVQHTAMLFQLAKIVTENLGAVDLAMESVDVASAVLDLDPRMAIRYQAMYATYIGSNDKSGSRFELDYLFRLPADLLIDLLPYMRRSDYLNEHGLFTSTVTAPDSIQIVARKASGKAVVCDLLECCLAPDGSILVPIGEGRLMPILSSSFDSLSLLDDIVAPYPASDFMIGGLAPKYNDPTYRYYDHLASATTSKGLELPTYTPDDLAVGA